MLPNVLQPNATDHVPVLAEEVREALAVRPGETVVDATFGAGGHARLLGRGPAGLRPLHRNRPGPVRQAVLRALPQHRGRDPDAPPARQLRDRAAAARLERGGGGRDPARPRRLEHAARPARARLLVRGRRAARHAHGSVGRGLGARARERARRARAADDLPSLRRGALREADRPRDRAPPPGAARSSGPATSSTRSAPRSRLPRASARAIRPSASSRRCGSRSTTSSAPSRRRCPQRSRCCGRAAGSR